MCQSPSAPTPSKTSVDQTAAEIQQALRDMGKRVHIHVPLPDFLFHGIADWVKELLFQHLIPTGYWNAVENSNGVAPIPNPFPQRIGVGA